MPVHDWTRVTPGIFHHFHHSWIEEIMRALNGGLLPPDYYALSEQIAGDFGPDVITLQTDLGNGSAGDAGAHAGGSRTALATSDAPPKVSFTATTEMDQYAAKQSTLVIRHSGGDRVVALVEIVSPGNKSNRHGLRAFVEKAAEALLRGYHLLILDLQPAGPREPHGIHGAIWGRIA